MNLLISILMLSFSITAWADLPEIKFIHESKIYKEGEKATVTATLSSPATTLVSIKLVPSLSSTADNTDHDMGDVAEILIAPGETTSSISFYILADEQNEGSEKLILEMTAPLNAKLPVNRRIQILITDDVPLEVPYVGFETYRTDTVEGSIVEVKLKLSFPTTSIVVVPVEYGATNSNHSDTNIPLYATSDAIFLPGETEASIVVQIYSDEVTEPEENVFFRLKDAVSNAVIGTYREHWVFFNDAPITPPALY